MGFLDWLTGASLRVSRAERYLYPGLVAYYWDGGIPSGRCIRNISASGAFVEVPDQWYTGTLLNLTLQVATANIADNDTAECLTVTCRVVREAPGGVGVEFMLDTSRDRKVLDRFLRRVIAGSGSVTLSRSLAGTEGQSLLEFALMLPLIFLLILNAVNFGGFIYAWITVANAARAGGQYAAMGAAYASYPSAATLSNIATLIQNETSSLPGASTSNPAITICENQNGTAISYPPTNPAGSCSSSTAPPRDPETITGITGASTYTTVAMDVTYTYTPFIGSFSAGLLSVVTPPTTVHRRLVMRVLN